MNSYKPKEKEESELWEKLSSLRDEYFLEETAPSYWKPKEGLENETQVIGDALDAIEELSSLRDQLRQRDEKLAELHNWIKSDSVYTLLRYGSKSPSSSGVDDCEDSYYADLYNLSAELRKNDRDKNSLT